MFLASSITTGTSWNVPCALIADSPAVSTLLVFLMYSPWNSQHLVNSGLTNPCVAPISIKCMLESHPPKLVLHGLLILRDSTHIKDLHAIMNNFFHVIPYAKWLNGTYQRSILHLGLCPLHAHPLPCTQLLLRSLAVLLLASLVVVAAGPCPGSLAVVLPVLSWKTEWDDPLVHIECK